MAVFLNITTHLWPDPNILTTEAINQTPQSSKTLTVPAFTTPTQPKPAPTSTISESTLAPHTIAANTSTAQSCPPRPPSSHASLAASFSLATAQSFTTPTQPKPAPTSAISEPTLAPHTIADNTISTTTGFPAFPKGNPTDTGSFPTNTISSFPKPTSPKPLASVAKPPKPQSFASQPFPSLAPQTTNSSPALPSRPKSSRSTPSQPRPFSESKTYPATAQPRTTTSVPITTPSRPSSTRPTQS
ncbi:MAG: hypothetical protein WDW36_008950 [Sanguina aurantia]